MAACRAGSRFISKVTYSSARPSAEQRAVGAVHRVFGRQRHLWDGLQRALSLLRQSRAFVVSSRARISPDHEQVLARADALMAGPGGENYHISGMQLEYLAVAAAEADAGLPARNAQHFMGAGMVMHVVVDTVAPRISPAVALEQLLECRRWIA